MMTPGGERRLAQVYGASGNLELKALYDAWAADYDQDLRDFGYTYPALMAGLVARHVRALTEPLLDAGVGTGILGEMLYALGYEQLVGIDLSDGMLAMARSKGVYAELSNQTLGQPLEFADDRFGAVVAAGVLTIGHAPPDSLDELVRVTRPGGLVIFTLTTPVYEEGGFKVKLQALIAAGRWRQRDLTGPCIALPHAPAEHAYTSRGYVFEVLP
jgi:predicted TPR repeat methyltransferase